MAKTLGQTVQNLGLSSGKKKVRSQLDLVQVIRKGLPIKALKAVSAQMNLSPAVTVKQLGLAKRTISRRIESNSLLSPDESERVVRLARVLAEAMEVLGGVEKARRWLQAPNRALGGAIPLQSLDTDLGTNAVLEELGRIEHGVFA